MKVIVLGNQVSFPKAGRHHVSFIVSEGTTNLLLEMGPGTCSRFQKYVPLQKLSAVLISHAHQDHLLDLFIFAYGVYMYNYLKRGVYHPDVYLTQHGINTVKAVAKVLDLEKYIESISLRQIKSEFTVGELTIRSYQTDHFVPTVALRIENNQGKSVTYTSDTAYIDGLAKFAESTDLLIAEATLKKTDESPEIKHMSGRLAGVLAHKSNARKLLLAHLWYEYNEDEILDEAKHTFKGPAEIAQEGRIYTV